jgi:hypothetical protein
MEPLSYQWRRNARNISNATNSSLSLTNVQVADNGDYSVLVANPAGCIVSLDGNLKVVELLPFGFGGVALSNGFFSFTYFGEGNRFYSLDESSDLTNWSSRQGISTPNGSWRFSLPINTNARFFRLRTAP